MRFDDIKRAGRTTCVFFPADLAGSLDDALRKAGETGWEIIMPDTASMRFDLPRPLAVRVYQDMDVMTDRIRALVSDFDPDGIMSRIYGLHEDPDASRSEQAGLRHRTAREDGCD